MKFIYLTLGCLALMGLVFSCDNTLNNDSLDETGELSIRGQLTGDSGSEKTIRSTSTSRSTIDGDGDWAVAAVWWDDDFEAPDIFGLVDPNTEVEGENLDFWDDQELIELDKNGEFSWTPPDGKRFVLFAIDRDDVTDPVKGLIGLGTGGEDAWLTMDTDLLSGEIDLGSIDTTSEGLIWSSETTVDDLINSNQLQESDTVLQLAYFSDGVRLLKNVLSLNYDIDTSISKREAEYFTWPMHGYDITPTTYDSLEDGHGPEEFVESYLGFGIYIISDSEGNVAISPPETTGDYNAGDFHEIIFDQVESTPWHGGALGGEDKTSVINDFYEKSWLIDLDGDQGNGEVRGINLGSTHGFADGFSSVPVPKISVDVREEEGEKYLKGFEVEWYKMTETGPEKLSASECEAIMSSYMIGITQWEHEEDNIDRKAAPFIIPDHPGDTYVSLPEDEEYGEWILPTEGHSPSNDGPYQVERITVMPMLRMGALSMHYPWLHDRESEYY